MATPLLALTELTNKQANAEVPLNLDLRHLERFATLNVLATQNAPPGSPANGDTYIVGAAGSGAWSGHNNQIASYQSGWYFFTPFTGIRAYDASLGETVGYSAAAAAFVSTPLQPWFPLQPRWSATEHWTGQFHGGIASTNRVFSKTFTITLPNIGTTTTAHSISALDLGTTSLMTLEGKYVNSGTAWFFNNVSASSMVQWNVNATNILAISAQNLSLHTARIRLCYQRTGLT